MTTITPAPAVDTPTGSLVGAPVRRVEDEAVLTGTAQYLDDLPVEGVAHLHLVRSTVAHAQITELDVDEARTMPGVLGVFTAADLPLAPILVSPVAPPALARPPLASDVVRFVGDAVVAIVAEDRAAALDAAEAVIVDYEPLPAAVDPTEAASPDAPLLFPEHGTNVVLGFDEGDEHVLDGADRVVRGRFVNQRLAAVPLEPNGCLAVPERDGEVGALSVWISTQAPHLVRDSLARALELDPDDVRVIAPAVGGAFGAKMFVYVEYVITAALARRIDRPVKWVETRSESMVALTHGRGQVQEVELGVTETGDFTGLSVRVTADAGAYPGTGAYLPALTRTMASGVYRIPRIAFASRSVMTPTTPVGAYRGAGRPEATALVERIVDLAAAELGLDPAELRRRNLIPADAFPYETAVGSTYDVGDYQRALDEALRVADYDARRAEQVARRARRDPRALGIGLSCYVEVTAGGTWKEWVGVEIHADGTVTARVGTAAHGQGHETALAQIVADRLGVDVASVRLVQSDTAAIPRGLGTMGSRTVQIAGAGLAEACDELVDRARPIAAGLLGAAAPEVAVAPGRGLGLTTDPARAVGWSALAQAAAAAGEPLRVEGDHDQGAATYPFGAHVAVVEVDTETGLVELLRHVAVDDAGSIVNPLLADGQVQGGIAQGVGQALFEEFAYDDDGNPITANLVDYSIPSAAELPTFETSRTVTPTPLNVLGAKGIGESGTIGSTPAVQNAVVDALAHLGVRHVDMPATPQRVWEALRAAAGNADADGPMGGRRS